MEANELRIGNWVKLKFNPKYPKTPLDTIVNCISYDHLLPEDYMINGYSIEKIEPIPLTPEILEKAGFELHPVVKHWWKSSDNYMVIIHSEKDKPFVYWVNSMQVKELKYLHEVQNLHFVLTGKELTINF